ncbi:MAG: hypothetical protein JSU86_15920, partial [Phycisphaerales bacterium]
DSTCDPLGAEGNCDTPGGPINEGLACDDGFGVCSVGETCQSGACTGGALPDCSGAGDQCNTASCDPAGLEGNCDTLTPVTDGTACDDGAPCTDAECQSGSCVFSNDAAQITVELKFDAINSLLAPITRDTTFVITTCGGSTDTRVLPVVIDESGFATVVLDNVDVDAGWISVREGHTLRRLAVPSFSLCAATVDLRGASQLLSGDFQTGVVSQDGLVDITDFSILAANFNTPIEPGLSTGADATGNGVQGTDDFTAIQVNFLTLGEAVDGCGGSAGIMRDGVVTIIGVDGAVMALQAMPLAAVDVDSLPIRGAGRADLNGDGVVDGRDIRAFARRHKLPLLPEFDRKLAQLETTKPGRRRR